MRKKLLLVCCLSFSLFTFGENKEFSFRQPLSICFDKDCSLNGQSIWYAGILKCGRGRTKPNYPMIRHQSDYRM